MAQRGAPPFIMVHGVAVVRMADILPWNDTCHEWGSVSIPALLQYGTTCDQITKSLMLNLSHNRVT
jgi:hypothetical protein